MLISDQRLLVKIFTGFHATSELKMHLAQSKIWQENLILTFNQSDCLKLVHFREKDYIGKYLMSSSISLKDLSNIEAKLKTELLEYCPKFKQEKLLMRLFSQTFIL